MGSKNCDLGVLSSFFLHVANVTQTHCKQFLTKNWKFKKITKSDKILH